MCCVCVCVVCVFFFPAVDTSDQIIEEVMQACVCVCVCVCVLCCVCECVALGPIHEKLKATYTSNSPSIGP